MECHGYGQLRLRQPSCPRSRCDTERRGGVVRRLRSGVRVRIDIWWPSVPAAVMTGPPLLHEGQKQPKRQLLYGRQSFARPLMSSKEKVERAITSLPVPRRPYGSGVPFMTATTMSGESQIETIMSPAFSL